MRTGKGTQNLNELCLNVFGKLHILVEIGYLLLKIMQFYVFKMAANGGRHFEINIKTENYKTQFISQNHANSCTFDKCGVNFMQLIILCGYFMNIVLAEGIIGKKSIFSVS